MRTHQCTTTIDDPNNLRATIGGWSRSVTTPSVATELEILFSDSWNLEQSSISLHASFLLPI